MSEPEYIAQTFEREHTRDPQAWFSRRMDEAREKGLRYLRFTHDNGGLLIEVWSERWPQDQGEPRWQMTY